MTQSAYANTTINNMLVWLKGFANWVLKMFNLAGRGGISPLTWLTENWLQLLVALLIIGVIVDVLIYLIRWRPYWVWFRRKRILIEDENFFNQQAAPAASQLDAELFGTEEDEEEEESPYVRRRDDEGANEFVVASTVVHRAPRTRDTNAGADDGRYRRPSTIITRDQPTEAQEPEEEVDIFGQSILDRKPLFPPEEDDVFNVSDLPEAAQPEEYEPQARRVRPGRKR